MREFVERIAISAPPSRVWAVMADLESWPEWTSSMSRVQTLEWATTGVGSRFRVEQPKLRPTEFTTTEWQPGSGFTWESRAPGVRSVASHRIESSRDGSEVALSLRFDGWMGPLVGLFAGGLVRRYMRMEAAGLKARAERS
jgi:uncharacterized membrane protein